jgi:type VI secretion system protein ImpJ
MSAGAKVVWSEGMFLRTQHFQQQERWIEGLVRDSVRDLRGHAWGVRVLELDTGLLAQGKVALRRCEGIMPDGTPFAVPDAAPHPDPLLVLPEIGSTVVHLGLPVRLEGSVEVDPAGAPSSGARFRAREIEIRDIIAGAETRAPVHVADPGFRLLPEKQRRDAYVTLPIARVASVQTDGGLLLDQEFIAPCLNIRPSPVLVSFLEEMAGKLESIARERAAFVGGKRLAGAGDIADFLILQLCNRTEASARHLVDQKTVHPEDLYGWLLGVAGEASTFTADLRPAPLPTYRHEEPSVSFMPLVAELRRLLLELSRPDRKAIQIPLKVYPSGVRAAEVQDSGLYTAASFVIAFNAPVAPEAIRSRLPGQIKIGPAEELQSIVRAAVPGIPLRHLPTVPREIPLHRGMIYFELDRNNEYWRRLPNSAGLAFHVTGDLREGMDMECWAIRD